MKRYILDKILTVKGETMIYYRNYGSLVTDIKTEVIKQ